MQNKRYTIQFFSLPNDQLHSLSLSSDRGTHRTPRICRSCSSLPYSQPPFIYWSWCLW